MARLCLLLAAVALVTSADAQTAHPAEGSWRHTGDPAEQQTRFRAIDAATEEVPFLCRGRVRRTIRERSTPARHFVIRRLPGAFVFERDRGTVSLPESGASRLIEREDGDERMRAWIDDDGRLRLTGERDGNQRTLIYDVRGDALTIHVRIVSERLDRPIAFRLSYRRSRSMNAR